MSLTKRDAARLVDDIRHAKVSGHVIAARSSAVLHPGLSESAFLGGLEAVLCHFLRQQGQGDACRALIKAMNDAPTPSEIAARNATLGQPRTTP